GGEPNGPDAGAVTRPRHWHNPPLGVVAHPTDPRRQAGRPPPPRRPEGAVVVPPHPLPRPAQGAPHAPQVVVQEEPHLPPAHLGQRQIPLPDIQRLPAGALGQQRPPRPGRRVGDERGFLAPRGPGDQVAVAVVDVAHLTPP